MRCPPRRPADALFQQAAEARAQVEAAAAFTLRIDGPKHSAYDNHVSQAHGSRYCFVQAELPASFPMSSSGCSSDGARRGDS